MKTDADIELLVRSFEECTLPRPQWTHTAHLTVALWYLIHYPRNEATERIRRGIERYNLSVANPTGYHETVTLAWIAVICRFLAARREGESVAELDESLSRECGGVDYLLRFYSKDRLFSEISRRTWVPPDRHAIEPVVPEMAVPTDARH